MPEQRSVIYNNYMLVVQAGWYSPYQLLYVADSFLMWKLITNNHNKSRLLSKK